MVRNTDEVQNGHSICLICKVRLTLAIIHSMIGRCVQDAVRSYAQQQFACAGKVGHIYFFAGETNNVVVLQCSNEIVTELSICAEECNSHEVCNDMIEPTTIFGSSSNISEEILMAKDVSAPKVGEEAPDFTLKSHLDSDVTLSSFRGKKNVVLAFYPLAFTPV